ncbi:MAG: cation:proton antiporter [Steroidobacteraceae bacterium]
MNLNIFILFGLLLVAGVIGGDLARRSKKVPRILGYMLMGFIVGPHVLGWIGGDSIKEVQIFIDLALALILYQIGAYLNLREIISDAHLISSSFIESLLTFGVVAVGLHLYGVSVLMSFLFGAIAISSSPAVILATIKEYGVKGVFTKRILNLVALNNLFSFLFFMLMIPFVHYHQDQPLWKVISFTPVMLFGSFALGWVLAMLKAMLNAKVTDSRHNHIGILLGFVALGLGLAQMLHLSHLLTMLTVGLFSFNAPKYHSDQVTPLDEPGDISELSIMILFVIAGAKLELGNFSALIGFTLLFVFLRGVSKIAGLYIVRPDKAINAKDTFLLGLSLTPMAGLAMGLSLMLNNLYPELMSAYVPYVFAVVAVLEVIGPFATEYSLRKSGEIEAGQSINH